MDGITDLPYRYITARHGGPDVCFTEFTAVDRIAGGYDPGLSELRYSEKERPVVAQVFGVNPEAFYQVAHVICELGFDGIDINMGCPSKTIANRGAGAGLIKTPELARRIIRKTRDGVADWASGQGLDRIGLPDVVLQGIHQRMSRKRRALCTGKGQGSRKAIKTRLGYDHVAIDDWMHHLLSESPAVITVHGRTLSQFYRGEADWESIARAVKIAHGSDTLLLGNGDIRSVETAVRRLRETGAHGVLLGRITLGNPWIFTARDEIREAVRTGGVIPDEPEVSSNRRLKVALEHARVFHWVRGHRSYRSIRKYLASYCRGFPNASEIRRHLVQADTLSDIQLILKPLIQSEDPEEGYNRVRVNKTLCV